MEYFNKALDIESSFYKNSPNLATTYNNIGSTYKRIGKYEKAMEYYKMSLTILKSTFGENHPDVATCYSNLGSLLYNQGDFAKALEYCDEALTIRKTILGENHPDIASSYNTIGEIYDELGDKSMSWECLDKALIIRESIFGDNHPEVAQSYNNIGLWYYYKNPHDYDKALDYLNKALAIYNSVFKENHPKSISTQYSITSVEYQQVIANNTIATFCEDHCFTATIVEGETPASQQGMSGEYILLEYADWNQDSHTSMFDKNDELRGKPKDILVMKDDVIAEYHFENLIGAQLGIKYVGKEEKQRINKAYQEWKKQNRK